MIFASLTVLIATTASAEVVQPCGDSFGSSADRAAIENALYAGTAEQARTAIAAAKATRGTAMGCPDTAWPHVAADPTPPTLESLAAVWNDVHAPGLAAYEAGACAPLGRDWPAAGLGGYYARLAGYAARLDSLRALARDLADAQYSTATAPAPLITYPGLYAYAHAMSEPANNCYRPGVIEDGINLFCGTVPSYCPTYNVGTWSGGGFLVVDFSVSPRAYDGGAAYDHGWAAQFMIEAWLQETDPALRQQFETSARLAGDWARDEPAVRNHNYTAKLIWALGELYAAKGEAKWKTAMQDKLERSLKPGVLMDLDHDGNVDGTAAQPFAALNSVAQTPGRMWDGHNSIAWYQCMNAWAMLEAYVAFRDRGDAAEAAELRPYVVAMFDNLALELNTFGTATQANTGAGIHPLPFGLALAIWKLARYEKDPQPDWETALWGIYNTGYFETFQAGRSTAALGVMLLIQSNTAFVPLPARTGEGSHEGSIAEPHTGDLNADGLIQLAELLRVIQFYNSLGVHCAAAGELTEDGYSPGHGPAEECPAHASDYNPQDWSVSLAELLRLIQFYNSLSYHRCADTGSEDGYCPGPA